MPDTEHTDDTEQQQDQNQNPPLPIREPGTNGTFYAGEYFPTEQV